MTPKQVFIREATGLIRDFTWFDGMVLGVAWYLPSISFMLLFGTMPFLYPGSNLILTIGVFGSLILIPAVLCYCFLAAAMPRSGGDYVYVSRGLAPSLGVAVGLIIMIYNAFSSIGFQGYFITTFLMGPQLSAIGSVNHNTAMLAFAQTVTQQWPQVLFGTLMLAICFVSITLPSRNLHRLYGILFIIAFLCYPVIFILVFAFTPHAQFVSAFNSFVSNAGINTSYDAIIGGAKQAGAVVLSPSWQASLTAVPFVMFTVAVPNNAAFIGGEIKNSRRGVPLAIAVALFGSTILTSIGGYFVYNSLGYEWVSALTSWGLSGAAGYPLPTVPYMSYFMAMLYPNLPFNLFMLLGGMAWSLLSMSACALMVSRILFAWAFDRVAPSTLADVSERFHSPVKANVIAILGGFVFLVATTFNFLGVVFNVTTAWTSAYIVVMITAAVLPFTKRGKSILEMSPAWVKRKILGLPIMTLCGILGTATLSIILYEILATPAISGASPSSTGLIIAFYFVGIIGYYVSKAYRKSREGIDIGLAFQEIPPE